MRAIQPAHDLPPRAIAYLRQSVARDESISIELQEIACREYATARGYEIVAVEVDEGISGRTWSKRPAVQRALDAIESKDAEIILLWKWSRLSRNRKDWAFAADRVDLAGGRIESATEPIDVSTAAGKFSRGMMTEMSAFISDQIGEQWAETHRHRFEAGLPPKGALPWGWVNHKTHITIDDASSDAIRTMYRMHRQGFGLVAIARWMNAQGHRTRSGKAWGYQTVKACLKSPIHAGLVAMDGQTRDGAHDGVISANDYARFMDDLTTRATPKRPRKSTYLLSSLVVCWCGHKRTGSTGNNGSGIPQPAYLCPNPTRHKARSRMCAPVDAEVGDWVKTLGISAREPARPRRLDTKIFNREIAAIKQRITRLTEGYADGTIPKEAYKATVQKLAGELATAEANHAKAKLTELRTPQAYLAGNESLIENWDLITVQKRQQLLRAILEYVRINADNTVEIKPKWTD